MSLNHIVNNGIGPPLDAHFNNLKLSGGVSTEYSSKPLNTADYQRRKTTDSNNFDIIICKVIPEESFDL